MLLPRKIIWKPTLQHRSKNSQKRLLVLLSVTMAAAINEDCVEVTRKSFLPQTIKINAYNTHIFFVNIPTAVWQLKHIYHYHPSYRGSFTTKMPVSPNISRI